MEPQQLDKLLVAKKKSKLFSLLILVAVLLVSGGLAAWYFLVKRPSQTVKPIYKTAQVTKGDLKSAITSTAKLEALNTVEIGAEISGRIEAIHVDFNDRVKRGQLLVEIDPEQYKASESEAEAKLRAARASVTEKEAAVEESRRTAERAKALSERGLISNQEMESATANAAKAVAALESARANASLSAASLTAARSKLLKTKITSPIDGAVLSRKVAVGQSVNSAMQTPVLLTLAQDLSHMQLLAKVDEADIGSVREGQKATFTVDAYTDRPFDSRVTSIRNVATTDQNVVSYETLLSVDNKDLLLKPGMTATVEIITMLHSGVLLVPDAALRFTPPDAVAQRGMRGPPIPIIGTTSKKPAQTERRTALVKLGKMNAQESVVWVLDKQQPKPVKVKKVATDGTFTAVEGELTPGARVITDLASEGESE